jgi:hypothetical protein
VEGLAATLALLFGAFAVIAFGFGLVGAIREVSALGSLLSLACIVLLVMVGVAMRDALRRLQS